MPRPRGNGVEAADPGHRGGARWNDSISTRAAIREPSPAARPTGVASSDRERAELLDLLGRAAGNLGHAGGRLLAGVARVSRRYGRLAVTWKAAAVGDRKGRRGLGGRSVRLAGVDHSVAVRGAGGAAMTAAVPAPPPCPRCYRQHRHWRTFAACTLRPILWIAGNGPWASISDCPISGRGEGRTVILFDDRDEVLAAKAGIDRLACGGCCRRLHHVATCGPWPSGGRRVTGTAERPEAPPLPDVPVPDPDGLPVKLGLSPRRSSCGSGGAWKRDLAEAEWKLPNIRATGPGWCRTT